MKPRVAVAASEHSVCWEILQAALPKMSEHADAVSAFKTHRTMHAGRTNPSYIFFFFFFFLIRRDGDKRYAARRNRRSRIRCSGRCRSRLRPFPRRVRVPCSRVRAHQPDRAGPIERRGVWLAAPFFPHHTDRAVAASARTHRARGHLSPPCPVMLLRPPPLLVAAIPYRPAALLMRCDECYDMQH